MSQVPVKRHVKYLARYLELKELNVNCWNEGPKNEQFPGPFDSTLKKNTSFIKRCRINLNEANLDILLSEIKSVSLEKYLSEIIPALAEGLTKCKLASDFMTGVEVTSLLHQRFGGTHFTVHLISLFLQGIQFPNPTQLNSMSTIERRNVINETMARHSIIMRVVFEFWIVGLFRSVADLTSSGGLSRNSIPAFMTRGNNGVILPPPLAVLYQILQNDDQSSFPATDVVISLLKNFRGILVVDEANPTSTDEELVYTATKAQFMHLFGSYVKRVEDRLENLSRTIRYTNRKNETMFMNRGKTDEAKVQLVAEMKANFADLNARYQSLCELIGRKIVLYQTDVEESHTMKINVWATNQESIWDDDEDRLFYEDLPNLSPPSSDESNADMDGTDEPVKEETEEDLEQLAAQAEALEESKKAEEEALLAQLEGVAEGFEGVESLNAPESDGVGDSVANESEPKQATSSMTANGSEETTLAKPKPIDDNKPGVQASAAVPPSETEEPESSTSQRISELILLLVNRPSKDTTDHVATEFMKYNNKDSQNYLVRKIENIHPANIHATSFIARFLAILTTGAPAVTQRVIDYHMKYFDYLQRKRNIPALESRRRFNIRILSELAKFNLLTNYSVFHIFKSLLSKLDKYNCEFLMAFLENCGRFLLGKPKYAVVTDKSIEVLKLQLKSGKVDAEGKFMLEGAVSYVDPKQSNVVTEKRPIIEQFIRRLVQYDLSPLTVAKIMVTLLKIDFINDHEAEAAIYKAFTKIWKVNVTNVPLIAWLLKVFYNYYPKLVLTVIDNNLENIRRGLETAGFQTNQQRVTEVLYLAEMFKEYLVDADVIWNTLYMLISLGHVNGRPEPGKGVVLDPVNNFFRIRLVCVLLQTVAIGSRFQNDRGIEKKLHAFLRAFDYYIYTKDTLSLDMNYMVQDTVQKVSPSFVRASNIVEAIEYMRQPPASAPASASSLAAKTKLQQVKQTVLVSDDGNMFRRQRDALPPKPTNPLSEEELIIKAEAAKKREALLEKKRQEEERQRAEEDFEQQLTQLMLDRTPATADKPIPKVPAGRVQIKTVFDKTKGKMVLATSSDNNNKNGKQLLSRPGLSATTSAPYANVQVANSASKSFDAPIPRVAPAKSSVPGKVAFRLLTKKQGHADGSPSINIPEDSNFAVQTKAESAKLREEQEKLTSFVLGYVQQNSTSDDTSDILKINQPVLESARYTKNAKKSELSKQTPVDIQQAAGAQPVQQNADQ